MKTPYQQGVEEGIWTLKRVHDYGFASPQAALDQQEKIYQEALRDELPRLQRKNPAYAKAQAEFREGIITTARKTLGALMQDHTQN